MYTPNLDPVVERLMLIQDYTEATGVATTKAQASILNAFGLEEQEEIFLEIMRLRAPLSRGGTK